MDGFVSAGIAGILFAEDFGDPAPVPNVLPAAAPLPEPPAFPAMTEAELDAACIRAVGEAERAWSDGAAERRVLALEAIAANLAVLRAEAQAATEAVADALARAVLAALAAVLPALCRAHGDGEVRALVREILPALGPKAAVTIRARAEVLDAVAADIAVLDEDGAAGLQLRAADLPPGDVRLSWEAGGLRRDSAAILAAVSGCLGELGLLPVSPPPEPEPEPKPEPEPARVAAATVPSPVPAGPPARARSLAHAE